jgi:hypothetical protein
MLRVIEDQLRQTTGDEPREVAAVAEAAERKSAIAGEAMDADGSPLGGYSGH